jgi:hypothetical protein
MSVPRPIEQVLVELEDHILSRWILIRMVTQVSKLVLKEHIVGPSRDINFINSFFSTLKRDMGPMTRDVATYEVSLEKWIFKRGLGISCQREFLETYIEYKAQGRI